MSHKHARQLRRVLEGLEKDIATVIITKMKEKKIDEIELYPYDVQGSLIYNPIDDQEAESIGSIYLKYDTKSPDKCRIVARVGQYEDDYDVEFKDLNIDLKLNVLEAFEEAIIEELKEE